MSDLPKAEFLASIPKKNIGSIVLLQNEKGEFLLEKPSYHDFWIAPGGVVEKNESPKAGAVREIKEELGLELNSLDFLGVVYGQSDFGTEFDLIVFIFNGGVLSTEKIKDIKIDGEEILDFKFFKKEEIDSMLGPAEKIEIIKFGISNLEKMEVGYLEV